MAGLRYSERTKTTILNNIKASGVVGCGKPLRNTRSRPKRFTAGSTPRISSPAPGFWPRTASSKESWRAACASLKDWPPTLKKRADPPHKTMQPPKAATLYSYKPLSIGSDRFYRPLQSSGKRRAANVGRDQAPDKPAPAPPLLGRQKAGACSELVA